MNPLGSRACKPFDSAPRQVHRSLDAGSPPTLSWVAADTWSAGVVLFALLAMALPFAGSDRTEEERQELRDKICDGEWDGEPECSAPALDLLERILDVNPSTRLSPEAACAHPWVGGVPVEEARAAARRAGREAQDAPDARDVELM